MYDAGKGAQVVVRRHVQTEWSDFADSDFQLIRGGVSAPFDGIGHYKTEFLPWKGGLLAANGVEDDPSGNRDPGWGDLWTIGAGGSPVTRIIHRHGVAWSLIRTDKTGTAWLTAGGYDGPWRKFYDYSTLYKLPAAGALEKVLTVRGDWTFYGLDRTGKWVIGTRWLGAEMGAYDLIAVNIKSRKQVEIEGAVSDCHLIEPGS